MTLHRSTDTRGTLADAETDAIVTFLRSLTGDQPKVVYPTLPASTGSTPRPEP